MSTLLARQIGTVTTTRDGYRIEVLTPYRDGLRGLEGFGHVVVAWWFSHADTDEARATVSVPPPYRRSPESLGVFATRAETRPTPLGLTVARVLDVDGTGVDVAFVDALPGTPVIDLKPYTPSIDRVADPEVPDWSAHWPGCVETAGDFDWGAEMRF